jgi:multiple antibiotic resistance protein
MSLQELAVFFATSVISLLAIMDPLGAMPVFLAVTHDNTDRERSVIARRALLATVVILVLFGALGRHVFSAFGITMPAFSIAGGLILLRIAFNMLEARPRRTRRTPQEEEEAMRKEDVAIIPLAMPLLAGPGTITGVMVLVAQSRAALQLVSIVVAVVLVSTISFFLLRAASKVQSLLGTTGLHIITRVMGLLLAAISVQFVLNGLAAVLKMATAAS